MKRGHYNIEVGDIMDCSLGIGVVLPANRFIAISGGGRRDGGGIIQKVGKIPAHAHPLMDHEVSHLGPEIALAVKCIRRAVRKGLGAVSV